VSLLKVPLCAQYSECHYVECHYAQCHYAQCHYAECHYAVCRYNFVFILCVIIHNAVMLNAITSGHGLAQKDQTRLEMSSRANDPSLLGQRPKKVFEF